MKYDFEHWKHHFKRALKNRMLPGVEKSTLPTDEVALLAESIRQFQKGENSEGKFLLKRAQEWSALGKDQSYVTSMQDFIYEEQHHAKMLGLWMAGQGIETLDSHWTEVAFTLLRRLGGIEFSISVLLTAELVSTEFYDAVKHYTTSETLKSICIRINEDEKHHIRFQAEALGKFSGDKGVIRNFLVDSLRVVFLAGTTLVVWKEHRKVLRAGGKRLLDVFTNSLNRFRYTQGIIQQFRQDVKVFELNEMGIQLETSKVL